MSTLSDKYQGDYEETVQRSISFTGLEHDFVIQTKIVLLKELFSERFGGVRPRLLDVGCGVGRMHNSLASIVSSLSGSDLSRESIERARQEHPWVEYREADEERLPWPDASFDVSLAVCVLHHVAPESRDGLISEMLRVTRAGGLLVVIEHNPWNPATRLGVARCPFDEDAVLLSARDGREILRRNRLAEVESRHFLLLPSLKPWARRLERRLEQVALGAQYLAAGTVQ